MDFLAGQLKTAEIFAVEVRKFDGGGERALVPNLVSTPKRVPTSTQGREWDERSFLEELRRAHPHEEAVARRLMDWARSNMTDFWYGKGSTAGSCVPRLFLPEGGRLLLFALWTYGAVEMQFQHMSVPPLTDYANRRKLIEGLNRIPGIAIPDSSIKKRPSFSMRVLADDDSLRTFQRVMDEAVQMVRAAQTHPFMPGSSSLLP